MNTARGALRNIAGKGIAIALAGTLALYGAPAMAFAVETQQPGGQPSGQQGEPGGQPGGSAGASGSSGGSNTQTYDYSGSYSATLTADGEAKSVSGGTYEAADSLVNVALSRNGGTLSIADSTLVKSGDATDGDSCNFYGVNSILLAVGDGSTATVSGSTLSATSEGSNGVFATDGATAYANNSSISTTAGNSRGLDATYGGTVVANAMSITTKGNHCATLATDRGGGNISVTNSRLGTAGSGSPLVYSTGTIELDNVTGTATGSQIAGMEGLNIVRIYSSSLTSTVTGKTASDPVANGVIIYQSTSGDAETSAGSTARFEAVDSTLSSAIASGALFYLTNTTADVVLDGTTLNFDSASADLVRAAGNDSNSWGSAGSNGATASFTGIVETLEGDAVADTISSLSLYLLDGTTWTGATRIEANYAGSTSSDPLTVNVDGSSAWVVSESCTLSALNVASGGAVVDQSGKTVGIEANGETVVSGESDIVVTVTGAYSTTVSTGVEQQLSSSTISRAGFDEAFGTSTTFGENAGGDNGSSSGGSEADAQEMYRLYNPNSGEHFYTRSSSEKNNLVAEGWTYEGVGWTAPTKSNVPVYRLYNQYGGEHHYTTSAIERDVLLAAGWSDEGIGWYSADDSGTPVYRQYNPNAYANNHNYTTSQEENDYLASLGWQEEGIAWYGI